MNSIYGFPPCKELSLENAVDLISFIRGFNLRMRIDVWRENFLQTLRRR